MILGNAPSYPPAEELRAIVNIFVMFMHPNFTAQTQPMDQDILRLTKLYYRNSLFNAILNNNTIGTAMKKL